MSFEDLTQIKFKKIEDFILVNQSRSAHDKLNDWAKKRWFMSMVCTDGAGQMLLFYKRGGTQDQSINLSEEEKNILKTIDSTFNMNQPYF